MIPFSVEDQSYLQYTSFEGWADRILSPWHRNQNTPYSFWCPSNSPSAHVALKKESFGKKITLFRLKKVCVEPWAGIVICGKVSSKAAFKELYTAIGPNPWKAYEGDDLTTTKQLTLLVRAISASVTVAHSVASIASKPSSAAKSVKYFCLSETSCHFVAVSLRFFLLGTYSERRKKVTWDNQRNSMDLTGRLPLKENAISGNVLLRAALIELEYKGNGPAPWIQEELLGYVGVGGGGRR